MTPRRARISSRPAVSESVELEGVLLELGVDDVGVDVPGVELDPAEDDGVELVGVGVTGALGAVGVEVEPVVGVESGLLDELVGAGLMTTVYV